MRYLACVIGFLFIAPMADAAWRIETGRYGTVSKIGPFKIARNPNLGAALRAFGEPSRRNLVDSNACVVRWNRIGLKITFVNFGLPPEGETTCSGRYGYAQSFVAKGRRFASDRGLRPGMKVSAVRRRHPDAQRHSRAFWLRTYVSPYGDNRTLPAIRAVVRGGRVRGLVGWIGAGGD